MTSVHIDLHLRGDERIVHQEFTDFDTIQIGPVDGLGTVAFYIPSDLAAADKLLTALVEACNSIRSRKFRVAARV